MKSLKKILALCMCFVLVMSLCSCKKKEEPKTEKSGDKAQTTVATPTPTPLPPSVEELTAAFNAETEKLSAMFNVKDSEALVEKVKAGEDLSFTMPDGKFSVELSGGFSYDLLGFLSGEMSGTMTGSVEMANNIARGQTKLDLTTKVDSSKSIFGGNNGDETNKSVFSTDFYIDNTDGENVITYVKTAQDGEEDGWEKDVTSVEEVMDKMRESIDSYVKEGVTEQDNEKLFADSEEFRKSHSTTDYAGDGYSMTTEFAWDDFYKYYKSDFDKLIDSFAEIPAALMSIGGSSDEDNKQMNEAVQMISDCLNKMFSTAQGTFKCVTTFDSSKQVKEIKLTVNGLDFSSELKSGSTGEAAPVAFKISGLTATFKIDEPTSKSITIPQEIIDSAVEAPSDDFWDGDDYSWESGDWEDYDDGYWSDDNDWSDVEWGSADFRFDDGIYYLSLGNDYELPLEFGPEYQPDMYSYTLSLTPSDTCIAFISSSFIEQGDVDSIKDNADSWRNIYGNCEMKELDNGRGYVLIYSSDYVRSATAYISGSQGLHYPEIELNVYDSDTDIEALMQQLIQLIPEF